MEISQTAWQALPPRKKSRRAESGASDTPAPSNSDESSEPLSVKSHSNKNQQISDNVEARSSANNNYANATLDGKDGCAGENYEYLDHTADVQCHTWGPTLFAALEAMAPCMFNYMTDLSLVEADPAMTQEFQVGGHDLHTVLFAYMDEMLFRFCTDLFCITGVEVLSLDRDTFTLKVRAHGATFERSRHVQGTEIKAITYSNMQVHEGADRTDIYVIVDI